MSSAIFIFSSSRLLSSKPAIGFFVLGFFAALSAIFGLLAIHPPKIMRKRGQNESLMYNKKISNFFSSGDYKNELDKLLGDQDKITNQYAVEIYNLCAYYYRPKRKLFTYSRDFLLTGIVLAVLVFLVEYWLR